MYCPECGNSLDPDARFCPNCGIPLGFTQTETGAGRTCPTCGAPYSSGSLFCEACGASLDNAKPEPGTICPGCGSPYVPGSLFCNTCGMSLRTPVSGTTILEPIKRSQQASRTKMTLVVLEGRNVLANLELDQLNKPTLSIGSADDNDICIKSASNTVSHQHASLTKQDGSWILVDNDSTNGLYLSGQKMSKTRVSPGDVFTIGAKVLGRNCVTLLFGSGMMRWCLYDLSLKTNVSIGRFPGNDIVLPVATVSAQHAVMQLSDTGAWWIKDSGSFNGTYVDGQLALEPLQLVAGTPLIIGNVPAVFMGDYLLYSTERSGMDVIAHDLVKIRKNGTKKRVTTDHISLHIGKGEFVAIVGGSGCGKSTLLNELNGSDRATSGTVAIDGVDLYSNYTRLKNIIGYVPQEDIVYDNLTLIDMLRYAAELRMPPDTTPQEREMRAQEVIQLLELQDVVNNLINNLSGGQKKRASIAVELLADPRLLFLDEPTSGLDPGIERHLMYRLAEMAHEGRTIILVTHTTLNLHLCDQVVFLGPGGKLAFAGPPQEAKEFFGVEDFVDIYNLIGSNPDGWAHRFDSTRHDTIAGTGVVNDPDALKEKEIPSFLEQLSTLTKRYAHLLMNDKARLVLLLAQAPLLAALICIVAGSDCFKIYESTQSCLFAISCAAFWVGILDSIQEICKERTIFMREYAGGMRITAYVASKVLVLGTLCVIQAILLSGVFCLLEGIPPASLMFSPFELFMGVFLITFSAMCLGLMVSSLFKNADRAIAMAPLLIMPQILFSGLVFELEGASKVISTFVNCRWGMESLGTTANLNALDLEIYGEEITVPAQERILEDQTIDLPDMSTTYMGQNITVGAHQETFDSLTVNVPESSQLIDAGMLEHAIDSMYTFSVPHLLTTWGILLLFCIVSIFVCTGILALKARKS